MASIVEGAGVALNVVERGAGAPVLLIHGLASDAEAMAPAAEALAADARVIAYDRRGYGASGAPEPYRGTTVEEQAQDAAALLAALDAGPAVVCGDGFGALVALDLAKRHRPLVRAAVLSDPPLFMFVPEATERLAAQHVELEAAVREGGPEAGVEAWLGGRARRPGARARPRSASGVLRRLRRPRELAGHPPRAARTGRPRRRAHRTVVAAARRGRGRRAGRAAARPRRVPTTATSWRPRARCSRHPERHGALQAP